MVDSHTSLAKFLDANGFESGTPEEYAFTYLNFSNMQSNWVVPVVLRMLKPF